MTIWKFATGALTAAGLSASCAEAVTFNYSGAFDAADPYFAGRTFSGIFSYDENTPNAGTAHQAVYYNTNTAFSFVINGVTNDYGNLDPAAVKATGIQVDDFDPGDAFFDRWSISASVTDLVTSLSDLSFVAVLLLDLDQTAQDGIPANIVPFPNLSEMESKGLLIQFATGGYTTGAITSISQVPLPGSVSLLVTGLFGFGALARSRRRNPA